MSNISINLISDLKEIDKIITDNWVYERTRDDSYPGKDLLPEIYPYTECDFFGCYLDEIIGFICAHPSEHGTMVHIHMLKEFKQYGFEFAEKTLENYLHPLYGRVWAVVPDLYPDVLKFTKKLGFVEHKRIKESLLKDGVNYDGTILYKDE